MESAFAFDNTADSCTILVQVDQRTTSGDHTIFSTGQNKLSLAADGTAIQLEVNGSITTWSAATPTGKINLAVTVDRATWKTKLFTVTNAVVTEVINIDNIPDSIFDYLRMANGTTGDANHQAGEYADNADISFIGFWSRILSDNEKMDIANTTDVNGMLLV